MKTISDGRLDCVGFIVPERYSVNRLVALFRRANSLNSLELMYERKLRDIESEDMCAAHRKACQMDAYRASLIREDEIASGKYIGTRASGRAVKLASAGKAMVASVRRGTVRPDMPEPATRASNHVFSEAERALRAELSRI